MCLTFKNIYTLFELFETFDKKLWGHDPQIENNCCQFAEE